MAKCSVSGERFVKFVFSPCVALLSGPDVESLLEAENLSFEELLKPFSHLSKDVTLKDNNNLLHNISGLRINFRDAFRRPGSSHDVRALLKWVVSACAGTYSMTNAVVSSGSLKVAVPAATPWFEAWRCTFIQCLWPNVHEFLGCYLGCVFVVSTNHKDPVNGLVELTGRQVEMQQRSDWSYPSWFDSNTTKFYVLLHDASKTDRDRAEELFSQVKSTFGASNSYLLTLFTAENDQEKQFPTSLPNGGTADHVDHYNHKQSSATDVQPDPWLSYLLPHGYKPPVEKASDLLVDGDQTSSWSHPLHDQNSMPNSVPNKIALSTESADSLDPSTFFARSSRPHGRRISQADRDRIRLFIYEFVVRCLLPWVEQSLRNLNEQIAHRMRLSRSFLSATKKFFSNAVGGSNSSQPSGHLPPALMHSSSMTSFNYAPSFIGMAGAGGNMHAVSSDNTMGKNNIANSSDDLRVQDRPDLHTSGASFAIYTAEAPESQMRRLADLAFLFQQYEVAYQTYNVLKRDYQNDSAWLHYAGAQEMSALSIYMQGTNSQRQYPYHYMDSAVSTYLQYCRSAELALRATLLNAEALCSRGLYAEAAMSLLKLTSEDDDLTSGLLIEQTAYCVLQLRRPMPRKFAFRMALAAYRYGRAKQPRLAIRTYNLSLPVLKKRGWSMVEDHINYNVSKQAYLLGDLATSAATLRETLNPLSRQSPERQRLFIREYLTVLKNYLLSRAPSSDVPEPLNSLPEFPLPLLQPGGIKIMVGKPTSVSDDLSVEARGIQFSDEDDDPVDEEINSQGDLSSLICDRFPWWMESTDASESDSGDEKLTQSGAISSTPESTTYRSLVIDSSANNCRIARRLEHLLNCAKLIKDPLSPQSADKTLKQLNFPPNFVKTDRSDGKLIVPMGDNVTVQLVLWNPMRIPLVLTNLHLLWVFTPVRPENGSDQIVSANSSTDITNEVTHGNCSYRSRQVISTQTVPEFIILSNEHKPLQLSLLVKEMGTLEITGLCFDLNSDSTQQDTVVTFSSAEAADTKLDGDFYHDPVQKSVDEPPLFNDDSKNKAFTDGLLASRMNSAPLRNGVRGKITFACSPAVKDKPNRKKNHSDTITQCVITHPAPLLRVVFSEFPSKLLHGQIYRLDMSLTNAGSEPLTNVRFASNWPDFVTFGEDFSGHIGYPPSFVSEVGGTPVFGSDPSISSWQNVLHQKAGADAVSTLMPGQTTTLPIWMRAPNFACTPRRRSGRYHAHLKRSSSEANSFSWVTQNKTVHMVFQYEAVKSNPNYPALNSRFIRHRSELELYPSIRAEASASPSLNGSIRDLLISLRIQNVTSSKTRASFQISHISCASRHWTISPIAPGLATEPILLHPGEVATTYLRAHHYSPSSEPSNHLVCQPDTPSVNHNASFHGPQRSQKGILFSTVSLCTQPMDGFSTSAESSFDVTRTPSLNFLYRSGSNLARKAFLRKLVSSSHSNSDFNHLDLILVIFWKALPEACTVENGSPCFGQVHVPLIRRTSPPSTCSKSPTPVANTVMGEEHLGIPSTRMETSAPSPCISDAVQLRLQHRTVIPHRFYAECAKPHTSLALCSPLSLLRTALPNRLQCLNSEPCDRDSPRDNSLFIVPVEVELCNNSVLPISVLIELASCCNKTETMRPVQQDLVAFNPRGLYSDRHLVRITGILWSGVTGRIVTLTPGETKRAALKACVFRPGVYNANSLSLKLASLSDDEPAASRASGGLNCSVPSLFLIASTEALSKCLGSHVNSISGC
ncbi:unnamed protein product [Calicophoron daubneyi]|uniref:Trafficking protein particle complex subunit 8 n=1 Tax=Calicophoron daubneyi TaxID=300641 RepID=A0AAV2T6H2_CALDB